MAKEIKNVEILEAENLTVAINGLSKDDKSQFNRENVYFVKIGAKPGTQFNHPAVNAGIKIDSRSIHFDTLKSIAERNATKGVFDMENVNLSINIVKTENGVSKWTVANVMQTCSKTDFIIGCMSKGMSKEEAMELYELSL